MHVFNMLRNQPGIKSKIYVTYRYSYEAVPMFRCHHMSRSASTGHLRQWCNPDHIAKLPRLPPHGLR